MVHFCRFNEDEWPLLVVTLGGPSIPTHNLEGGEPVWFGGQANPLSSQTVPYPRIDSVHAATKGNRAPGGTVEAGPAAAGSVRVALPTPAASTRGFASVARMRRSALDFQGGTLSMSLAQLSAILAAAAQPFPADFSVPGYIRLYLYVHRVDGLEPGVYRYWPGHAELEPIRLGDQRVAAAGLSLGQDLAGNACVAFSMIADLAGAAHCHGDRGYRYAHFEAGAIGQGLYLAAEALGLGATGIGAFFDDEVNRYLGLAAEQVVYHFAIGYPVPDSRVVA
jgi:SagB-type dehydrogenase family enzyme